MESPEIISATHWLGIWNMVKNVGAILVVLGVAAELLGDWFSTPLHKILDDARTSEIARLNNETEKLRATNNALEKKVAPRRLTSEQHEVIVEQLTLLAPQRVVLDTALGASFEEDQFLADLEKTFLKAGWNAVRNRHVQLVGGALIVDHAKHVDVIFAGVSITPTTDPRSGKAASALVNILNDNGFYAFMGQPREKTKSPISGEPLDLERYELDLMVGEK